MIARRSILWLSALAAVLLSPCLASAQEESISLTNPMVADVSQHTIEIRSDFNGTQLLIFGARNVPGDLIIVVRGPTSNVTLRRKERIAGMWMHVDQRKYDTLPLFYALTSTKPLSRIAPPATLRALGLGEQRVLEVSNEKPNDKFDTALTQALAQRDWWQMPFGKITYFGESLFKVRLDLPDTLPSGDYTAEIYLFSKGKLLGFQTIPLESYKVGFDANIEYMAKHRSATYGLIAVFVALCGGWLGHRLFHRR